MDKKKEADQGQAEGQWVFKPGGDEPSSPPAANADAPADTDKTKPDDADSVTWTASEYIAHNKGFGWYALLLLGAVVFAALVYWVTDDVISAAVIIIVAIIFAIAARSKPRVLTYRLDRSGLTIGSKTYRYDSFKSFLLVQEGAFTNITFMPLKRFMPSLTVYFAPDDQQKILDVLSKHLPMQQGDGELVDRLMRRVRF